MAKVQHISEITPSFSFTEFDFYKDYEESFKMSKIGRIHALLPLQEMAVIFGLKDAYPRRKFGRKSCISPEGKVALMFLKSYTGLSATKLKDQLNANIHYQIFCGIRINSRNPLTNYKHIDDIILELSDRLKIQHQQEVLADVWKPYMQNPCAELFSDKQRSEIETITKIYCQHSNHQESGNAKESIPDRIVSINKPYVRPIVRGKEIKILRNAEGTLRTQADKRPNQEVGNRDNLLRHPHG